MNEKEFIDALTGLLNMPEFDGTKESSRARVAAKHKAHELIRLHKEKQRGSNRYCITVQIYVAAEDAGIARDQLMDDLDHLCEADSPVFGFIHPSLDDIREI